MDSLGILFNEVTLYFHGNSQFGNQREKDSFDFGFVNSAGEGHGHAVVVGCDADTVRRAVAHRQAESKSLILSFILWQINFPEIGDRAGFDFISEQTRSDSDADLF